MTRPPLADSAHLYDFKERQEVYRGRVFAMASELVDLPGPEGLTTVRRDYLSHPGAVAILAVRNWQDPDPQVCLIRQYRHPVGAYVWEIPAGLRDLDGEQPIDTAKRELWEETDLEAGTWHTLVDTFVSGGCSTEAIRIFLARDIQAAATKAERSEEEALMSLEWVSLSEAIEAIYDGRIHACSIIEAILAFALIHRENAYHRLRRADAEIFLGANAEAGFKP